MEDSNDKNFVIMQYLIKDNVLMALKPRSPSVISSYLNPYILQSFDKTL